MTPLFPLLCSAAREVAVPELSPAPSQDHSAGAHILHQTFTVSPPAHAFLIELCGVQGLFSLCNNHQRGSGLAHRPAQVADCSGFPGTEVFYKYPLLLQCSINNCLGEQWEHATPLVI